MKKENCGILESFAGQIETQVGDGTGTCSMTPISEQRIADTSDITVLLSLGSLCSRRIWSSTLDFTDVMAKGAIGFDWRDHNTPCRLVSQTFFRTTYSQLISDFLLAPIRKTPEECTLHSESIFTAFTCFIHTDVALGISVRILTPSLSQLKK